LRGGVLEETRSTPQWPDRFAKGWLPCARWRSLSQLQFCSTLPRRHRTRAGSLRAGRCRHQDQLARCPRRRRLATVNRRSVRCRPLCARKRTPDGSQIRWGRFRKSAPIV